MRERDGSAAGAGKRLGSPGNQQQCCVEISSQRFHVEALGADLDAALLLIARRAQTFTRASGAAIALSHGTEMVCRASSGRDAPSLGVRLKAGSGFSGECVRTGKLLRCE